MADKRALLAHAAGKRGLAPVAAGTVPLMCLTDVLTTPDRRYQAQDHDFAEISRDQVICGLHVHVGVEDRDLAAAALHRLSLWAPILLALSANSPYWLGADTGYASWRTVLWQRWPTAGPAPRVASAAEYDDFVAGLIRSGVITDAGMIYHDVRLSSHVPTIELRVCDAVPDLDTAVLIAAVFRALVRHSLREIRAGHAAPDIPYTCLRSATWRAARSALAGDLLDPQSLQPVRAPELVCRLIGDLEDDLRHYDDWERVQEGIKATLDRGSWAAIQRRTGRRQGLAAVVDLLTTRTSTST
ncbi:MAG: YbdK family carboxylate-amine ligase [Streptomycetaceae bacterium]|nr:YbdK family carboxylate-amine ligase [Streptomycetaceae bacterium]